jgi:type VI protein secretion system component Hcp
MREIIFLSFGNNSNYVLSHFFNLNDELLKNKSNPLNLNNYSIYNESYRPRAILFDYSPNIQKYYSLNENIDQNTIESIKTKHDEKLQVFQTSGTQNNFLSMMSELNLVDTEIEDDDEKKEEEEEEEEEKPFLGKKKLLNAKTRKDNQDNMRKKIKRGFFNTSLIKFLNELLRSIGSHKYFRKFPHNFINDVHQERNKKIFGMTLREVLVEKKLYIHEENSGFNNYSHNLKVVQSEEIKENEEFKKILDKTIRELYEEYINSDEFKIGEINGLRKKEMTDEYIERYIYLANHFTEFLFQ